MTSIQKAQFEEWRGMQVTQHFYNALTNRRAEFVRKAVSERMSPDPLVARLKLEGVAFLDEVRELIVSGDFLPAESEGNETETPQPDENNG